MYFIFVYKKTQKIAETGYIVSFTDYIDFFEL